MDRARRRWQTQARLAALTRSAYEVAEGSIPSSAPISPRIPFEGDQSAALTDAEASLPDRRTRGDDARAPHAVARSWRVGVTPRAAGAFVVVLLVVGALLALRTLGTAGGSVAGEVHDAASEPASSAALPGGVGEGDVFDSPSPSPGSGAVGRQGETDVDVAGPLVVHVAGQVHRPGVVEVEHGSRVHDAVEAAGGALPGADLAAVNLARPVVDGEQVYLPAPGEAVAAQAQPSDPVSGASGLVNVNSADAAALDTLPGIGPALAQRILEWREQHGPFRSVEELLEVSGIGDATLRRLRDLVTV